MALIVEIKVTPNSGKQSWELNKNGVIKCFLKSAPEKGSANKELIKSLSKLIKVPQQNIEIISGLTSRNKKLKIHTDITMYQFLKSIGINGTQDSFIKPLYDLFSSH